VSRVLPQEPSFDPARWNAADAEAHVARGVELFNAGEYEEAHEEFEKLWLSTQGPDSDFFKGLVQASIALHHFQRGNLEGASKLFSGHRRYLAAYLPVHLGIDVGAFLRAMQESLAPVVHRAAGVEPRFDPASRPRIQRG
jgi:predicted metal-dependent hydrolase